MLLHCFYIKKKNVHVEIFPKNVQFRFLYVLYLVTNRKNYEYGDALGSLFLYIEEILKCSHLNVVLFLIILCEFRFRMKGKF